MNVNDWIQCIPWIVVLFMGVTMIVFGLIRYIIEKRTIKVVYSKQHDCQCLVFERFDFVSDLDEEKFLKLFKENKAMIQSESDKYQEFIVQFPGMKNPGGYDRTALLIEFAGFKKQHQKTKRLY